MSSSVAMLLAPRVRAVRGREKKLETVAVAPEPQDISVSLSLGRIHGDERGRRSLQPLQGLRQG
eukprot:4678155-Pleurochrysis_carterae.AAC.1